MYFASPSRPLCWVKGDELLLPVISSLSSAMWASLSPILSWRHVTLASWPFPIPKLSVFVRTLCFLSPYPLRSPPIHLSAEQGTCEDMSRPSPRSQQTRCENCGFVKRFDAQGGLESPCSSLLLERTEASASRVGRWGCFGRTRCDGDCSPGELGVRPDVQPTTQLFLIEE